MAISQVMKRVRALVLYFLLRTASHQFGLSPPLPRRCLESYLRRNTILRYANLPRHKHIRTERVDPDGGHEGKVWKASMERPRNVARVPLSHDLAVRLTLTQTDAIEISHLRFQKISSVRDASRKVSERPKKYEPSSNASLI
jgi:hypothetical protein